MIVDLAPALGRVLRSGGLVIASGILDWKADEVRRALEAEGIQVVEKKQEEDWAALVGRKT